MHSFKHLQKYLFTQKRPNKPRGLKIYECHVGIATNEERVGTYKEFADNIIPRIAAQGN